MAKNSRNSNDLLLARRVAAGDAGAQEEVFYKFKEFIYRLCLRIVHDTFTAEDMMQQTFIAIYQKIEGFGGNAKLKTWIYRIAVNQCLMHLRKERSKPLLESLTELEDYRPGVFHDRIEDRILLESCISELPESYRKFFILHDVCGYEHHECGALMDRSQGTSKSQLHKARQKMKKLVNRKSNPKMRVITGV